MRKTAPQSILLAFFLALLTGCASQMEFRGPAVTGPTIAGAALKGVIHGGQQPVAGATIQLYSVGTTGDGSQATPLLTSVVTSAADGTFNITGRYSCGSASLVYLTATAGNPGLSSVNPNIILVTALGPCASLSSSTFISVNELTTVAAAYALAPFAQQATYIGSSASDYQSLAAAFTLARQLVDTATGNASLATPPNGTSVPVAKLNTLGNLLATCVNTAGGSYPDNTTCGSLFQLTAPTLPLLQTDTFMAAVDLAGLPTLNTRALFNLIPANVPFQPTLTAAPADFSLGLTVTSGLQPSSLPVNFGNVVTGTTTLQTLTLTNTATSPIALSGFTLAGMNAAELTQTNNCPASLAAGAACNVQLSLSPSVYGIVVAVLDVANNSANTTLQIPVLGFGASAPGIASHITSISPALIPYGATTNQTITITGTNFASSAVGYLSTYTQLATTYISPQTLQVTIPAQYASSLSTYPLTVKSGGYTSNAVSLVVGNPAPTLTSISPASVEAGSYSFTMTLTGSGFTTASTVMINGVTHPVSLPGFPAGPTTTATITVSAADVASAGTFTVTVVNPAPGGGTSSGVPLNVISAENRLRTLSFPTADIVADPVRNALYAAVPSTSTTYANNIVTIDPLQGTVVGSYALSGQPNKLAISDDGSFLYVSLPANNTITRLKLPSLALDISYTLPAPAETLAVAPGAAHTLAVGYRVGYFGGTLAIYDDTVQRRLTLAGTSSTPSADNFTWGANAGIIYIALTASTGAPSEQQLTITADGVSSSSGINPSPLLNTVGYLYFNSTTNLLYDGVGNAVTPSTGGAAGHFSLLHSYTSVQNPAALDGTNGKAFFLSINPYSSGSSVGVVDLQSFGLANYSFLESLDITGLNGSKLVRWGTSGLAIAGGSQVYLVDGPFVSAAGITSPTGVSAGASAILSSISPQSVEVDSAALAVTLVGSNISPSATVSWNGQLIPATVLSNTQIVATIPASLLTQAVTAPFYISNSPGTENSTGIAFAVLPDLGPNLDIAAIGVSGDDMVWDPVHNLLYVAVTNPSAPLGNSVVAVDPASGTLGQTLRTNGQPSVLALSDNGQYLYAGLQKTPSIQRFTLAPITLDTTIPLAAYTAGENFAGEIKVAPGLPQTIAVTLGSVVNTVRSLGGVVLFDNLTPRAKTLPYTSPDTFKLAWGKDATQLFAHSDPAYGSNATSLLTVDGAGIESKTSTNPTSTSIGLRPHYDAGTNLLYSDGGQVRNPGDLSAAGFFETSLFTVPDSTLNRAFVLRAVTSNTYILDIYDLRRQVYLRSITLPGIVGTPTQMVRWGTQGLALLTDGDVGLLYLLQGSDLSGLTAPAPGTISLNPATLNVNSPVGTVVTVTGSGFAQSSLVAVNSVTRPTTFLSATQLTFQVTAADLSFGSYLAVAVNNTASGGTTTPETALEIDNPAPNLTNLGTPAILVNSTLGTLVVNGSGFVQDSIVDFNGSPRPTTFVASTQLIATLNPGDVIMAGKFPIMVVNPIPGGGSSGALTFEVDNPAPVLTSSYPTSAPVGGTGTTFSLTGSGFLSSTVVYANGSARPTSFYSSTSLAVALTTADLANTGNISLVAVTPGPGGGSSAAVLLPVNNGVPIIGLLSPSTVLSGNGVPRSITLTGQNFVQGTVVMLDYLPRATTYVSPTSVTFYLTVADQATVTTHYITLMNPAPGGGQSVYSANLQVIAMTPNPVITSIYPAQFYAGSSGNSINLSGTGFTAGAQILWNGSPLSTSYSFSSLYASVPDALLASTGTATIAVYSPTASTPLSAAMPVSIVNPIAPVLTSITPLNDPVNTAATITLTGNYFLPTTTVAVNGVPVPTTYSDRATLVATIPANLALPGNLNLTVSTPAPGGGVSAPAVFTVYIPLVSNHMVYSPATNLFYLSVPGSAGAPYGNSIVSLDPVTGALGTPIAVGSEPNQLALTSDGTALWVGLDGASAVRRVDLVGMTAGLQFALPTISYTNTPPKTTALVAIPGQPNSVVVATDGQTLAIYDNGVMRGVALNTYGVNALQIDGTRSEIYASVSSSYVTYLYSASGITTRGSVSVSQQLGRLQLASGRIYTDNSTVYDAESGSLLGTFASTSSRAPAAIDATLGHAFLLDGGVSSYNQFQVFDLSDPTKASTAAIPVNIPYSPDLYPQESMRWGTNGLAFHTSTAVFVLRSNAVKDLSGTSTDLGVTLTGTGANTTGSQSTYLATITNAGPSAASEVSLSVAIPATGIVVSATSSAGTCSTSSGITCNLGTLASGATVNATVQVRQLSPGLATATAQVSASQPDPNPANNVASYTSTVTGSSNAPVPVLTSFTPASVLAGSADTTITLAGNGFVNGSYVLLDGATLPTTFVSSTQLLATVPAASIQALSWHRITVSTQGPGGGVSAVLPLTVYSAIKAGASHILYDPFSRNIFATLGSAMPTGNSVQAITPESGVAAVPVQVGSDPSHMALSDDGQILYVIATGANQLVRYNMLKQAPEAAFTLLKGDPHSVSSAEVAVQTGSENTVAVSPASSGEIVDFDPASLIGTARPTVTYPGSIYSPAFLNATTLIGYPAYSGLARYTINPAGFGANPPTTLLANSGPFKLVNGRVFTVNGAVADATTSPIRFLGSFPLYGSGNSQGVAADTALGRAFFLASASGTVFTSQNASGIVSFDTGTYLQANYLPINFIAVDGGTSASTTPVDLIRWGQDGLAALTNSGTIYLVRGPVVTPQLLQTNSAPILTTITPAALQHGSGNAVLTITGSNFLPGVAASWNGSYRYTTLIDANHITVDIPASDLASATGAMVTAANPGSASSPTVVAIVN